MIKSFYILDNILILASNYIIIHCDTIEKSRLLLSHLDELGYCWLSKDSLKDNFPHYELNYKENTCYHINTHEKTVTFGSCKRYSEDYHIFEFDEICGNPLNTSIEQDGMPNSTDSRIYKTIPVCDYCKHRKLCKYEDKIKQTQEMIDLFMNESIMKADIISNVKVNCEKFEGHSLTVSGESSPYWGDYYQAITTTTTTSSSSEPIL